jgi:hypothetical protein
MTKSDIYTEWKKLCEEHENAREAYLKAFASVNQKFAAIGQGVSSENPNENELSEFEETWSAWEDIKKRMDLFVKENA